jgi:hypothetical protein
MDLSRPITGIIKPRELLDSKQEAMATFPLHQKTLADDTIVIDFQDGRIRRWREYIGTQSCMRPTT